MQLTIPIHDEERELDLVLSVEVTLRPGEYDMMIAGIDQVTYWFGDYGGDVTFAAEHHLGVIREIRHRYERIIHMEIEKQLERLSCPPN